MTCNCTNKVHMPANPMTNVTIRGGHDFMASMCVPPNKIMIGLMCGQDDADNVLTLDEALDITTYVQDELVKGIVLWDANIDGSGSTGNEPYAYCKGIQTMLVE